MRNAPLDQEEHDVLAIAAAGGLRGYEIREIYEDATGQPMPLRRFYCILERLKVVYLTSTLPDDETWFRGCGYNCLRNRIYEATDLGLEVFLE